MYYVYHKIVLYATIKFYSSNSAIFKLINFHIACF